jgi:hypothetical protein
MQRYFFFMRHLKVRSLYPELKQKDTLMDEYVTETETHETRGQGLIYFDRVWHSVRFPFALLP